MTLRELIRLVVAVLGWRAIVGFALFELAWTVQVVTLVLLLS